LWYELCKTNYDFEGYGSLKFQLILSY